MKTLADIPARLINACMEVYESQYMSISSGVETGMKAPEEISVRELVRYVISFVENDYYNLEEALEEFNFYGEYEELKTYAI